jgi:hypothetical protein
MGDVAPGEPPEVPYDPAGALEESRLLVPLLVKFPRGELGGKEVGSAVTAVDVWRTIMDALGLKVPEGAASVDLYDVAVGREPLQGRALVATLGNHYATRAGMWLLSGDFGRPPRLCQLDVDPACVADVFDRHALAGDALWRWTFDSESPPDSTAPRALPLQRREPASIDPDTAAALTVWGDL